MALSTGARLGPYEILGPLGAGGMGEVYRARDTKLGREVALKLLPEAVARDRDRLARFEREARLLASLNHPNIGGIYGFEQLDGVPLLVLELVPGFTLAEQIAGGAIELNEAIRLSIQIAEALEAAHEKGIVHRDLKPANIKVTPEGKVKVLDFGLAKAVAGDSASIDPSDSSTMTVAAGATRVGMILGTAAYMSPEQARGRPVDRRTDVWAFGCVLYEALTGRGAFRGESLTDTMAAVLRQEPDWSALPPETPPPVRLLLRRCLQKDHGRRLRDIGDARLDLEATLDHPAVPEEAPPPKPEPRRKLPWTLAAVCATLALGISVVHFGETPPEADPVRFVVAPLEKTRFSGSLALSPDGRLLVLRTVGADGRAFLTLRSLDSLRAQALAGSEDASYPFWSSDSRFVAFFSQGRLKRIDLTNPSSPGPVESVSPSSSYGGAWNGEGLIILGGGLGGGALERVVNGGVGPFTTLDASRQEVFQGFPHFLPDGRHVLYLSRSLGRRQDGIYIRSSDASETEPGRFLLPADSGAVYAAARRGSVGRLVYVREGRLMAHPFDGKRLAPIGEPTVVSDRVGYFAESGEGLYAVSDDGVLVYRDGTGLTSSLSWFDRQGKRLSTYGETGIYQNLRLSPDEKQVAVQAVDPISTERNIWIFDLARTIRSRFTFRDSRSPVWSPDGAHIAFDAPGRGMFRKAVTGAGQEELLLPAAEAGIESGDWSPDGRLVAFNIQNSKTGWDIWILPMAGDRKPFPFRQTPFLDFAGAFSPDGRWLAYVSDESGTPEVYVESFGREPSTRKQVSSKGGTRPLWRRDGGELFYLTPERGLMSVSITPGDRLEAGAPRPLFVTDVSPKPDASPYAVSRDGTRFLISTQTEDVTAAATVVVLNWNSGWR